MKAFVISLLMVFSLPCYAGDYDNRKSEVFSTLDSLKLDPYWSDPIKTKLTRYFDYREKTLYEAFNILQEDSLSDRDQNSKWKDYFSRASNEAAVKIYDTFQDAMPKSALLMLTTLATHESIFYSKIGEMQAALLRDRITLYLDSFGKESQSLSDKWREVNSNDESIDSISRDAQREFKDLYDETAEKVARCNGDIEGWIRTLLSAASALPSTPEIAGLIKDLLEFLSSMETRALNLADKMQDAYSKEDRLILVFNNTRKDVKDFLDGMNIKLLEQEMRERQVQVIETAKAMPTPGQVADALRYVDRINPIVKSHYEHFEDLYEKFVNEFDHIFFNALGDRTIEDLLETQSWRDWSESVRALAIEQALHQLYERAEHNFGIDIHSIEDSHQRELVERWVAKNMEALIPKLGKIEQLTLSDRIRIVIYSGLPSSLRAKLLERLKNP